MRRVIVLSLVILGIVGISGPASASEGATTVRWETDYTGDNNWGNPCLGVPVSITTTVHVTGVFTITPSGIEHYASTSTVKDGFDDQGWIMIRNQVISLDTFQTPDGRGVHRWQWLPVMEDPATGQRYRASLLVQAVRTPNGDIVVDTGPYGSTANNTCVPRGVWPTAWGPFPGS